MIRFEFDPSAMDALIDKLDGRAINISARHGINKAIAISNKIIQRDLKKRYGLGVKSSPGHRPSTNSMLAVKKMRMQMMRRNQSALIWARYKPLSLINWVDRVKKQTGYREKISCKIKGKDIPLGKSFIRKPSTRAGGYQVFSRGRGANKPEIFRRTLPHPHSVMQRKEISNYMESESWIAFQKAFDKKLKEKARNIGGVTIS